MMIRPLLRPFTRHSRVLAKSASISLRRLPTNLHKGHLIWINESCRRAPPSVLVGSPRFVSTETRDEEFPAFHEIKGLHPNSKRAIQAMGLERMTEIQAKTWKAVVQGEDVLGRARTGTGKTIAFLLPSLERILRDQEPADEGQIQVLVLSPTRELASQIGVQAERLVRPYHKQVFTQVVFGGSSKDLDVKRFQHHVPHILVATPGRLQDHLENTKVRNRTMRDLLQRLKILVLDETDRLLDMGFRQDIFKILSYLPKERQTLLYSATVPDSVKAVVQSAVKPNYTLVDCILDTDPATHVNEQVNQSVVILPNDRLLAGVVEIILDLARDNHKLMVFFPTTAVVSYFTELFHRYNLGQQPVMELHSRKTQAQRTRVSDQFRRSRKGAILFTSDVSARGVDYPNVTHVIQVGPPPDRETYIHRLGRTARAGKKGQGILVLLDSETIFLKELEGIEVATKEQHQTLEPSKTLKEVLGVKHMHCDSVMAKKISAAYRSMLGYYRGLLRPLNMSKKTLVKTANTFSLDAGLDDIPLVSNRLAGTIGFSKSDGLNIGDVRRYGGGGKRGSLGSGSHGGFRGKRHGSSDSTTTASDRSKRSRTAFRKQ